ncbi:hypothetical protein SNEBB_004800 [Seison nebaliae]|nr:hypothetical protein SNEBB_004800 [Seison nebaliae]
MAATARQEKELIERSRATLQTTNDPIEKLRAACLSRGAHGIKGLGRLFKIMDDDGSKTIAEPEFVKGIMEYGLNFRKEEIKEMFRSFDSNHNGSVDFDEFLNRLRPPMNGRRRELIAKAFTKLDKTGDGRITVEDLRGVYDPRKHPKYQNGEWTEDQCLKQFLKCFEASSSKDEVITRDEFYNYYSGVSASIDNDAYFDLMMKNSWNINMNLNVGLYNRPTRKMMAPPGGKSTIFLGDDHKKIEQTPPPQTDNYSGYSSSPNVRPPVPPSQQLQQQQKQQHPQHNYGKRSTANSAGTNGSEIDRIFERHQQQNPSYNGNYNGNNGNMNMAHQFNPTYQVPMNNARPWEMREGGHGNQFNPNGYNQSLQSFNSNYTNNNSPSPHIQSPSSHQFQPQSMQQFPNLPSNYEPTISAQNSYRNENMDNSYKNNNNNNNNNNSYNNSNYQRPNIRLHQPPGGYSKGFW